MMVVFFDKVFTQKIFINIICSINFCNKNKKRI
jgi:hypothetical protein